MASGTCRNLNEILAEKLSILCEDKKMSRAQLAEKLHVSRQTIDNYMNGDVKNVPALMVLSMAEIFGVSTDYLMTESEIRTPDKRIEAVCSVTGLSEDAVFMLCRPEISGIAEYLLHDENNLDFFRRLRDYLETSLLRGDVFFGIDAFSPKVVRLLDGEPPLRESVYSIDRREIIEQCLLHRLRMDLEKFKEEYYDWLILRGERIEPDGEDEEQQSEG